MIKAVPLMDTFVLPVSVVPLDLPENFVPKSGRDFEKHRSMRQKICLIKREILTKEREIKKLRKELQKLESEKRKSKSL